MNENEEFARYVQNALTPLHDTLSGFSGLELLKIFGGLQLIPENASHQIRLEALAHIVATLDESKAGATPSPHRLRSILNCKILKEHPVGTAEDPCDNPFTEEITFFGGSFLILTGRGEETAFIFRWLASSIFLHPEPIDNNEFKIAARAVMGSSLVLSDAMTRRAGLTRGMSPKFDQNTKVPDSKTLKQLSDAVFFSDSQLNEIFSAADHKLAGLAPLVCPAGTNTFREYRIDSGPLLVRPLLTQNGGVLVSIPGSLLPAATNAVVWFAQMLGVVPQVAENFADTIWHSVYESLRRLDSDPFPVKLPPPPNLSCFREGLFSLDIDKIAHVMLFCDPLEGFDPGVFSQNWRVPHLQDLIRSRTSEIAEFAFSWPKVPNEIFVLVIVQSLGRSVLIGLNENTIPPWGPILCMTAADLDTITQLKDNEPLKLWKFARAHRKAVKQSKLISSGVLNEFAVYTERNHSYYFSDEARPTLMVFPPGSAGGLRREIVERVDLHGAPSYDIPGAIVDVGLLFPMRDIPIYAELRNIGRRVALVAEAYDLPVWVVGPVFDSDQPHQMRGQYLRFADAIAYWLWQFAPSLSAIISSSSLRTDILVIHFALVPHESWGRDMPYPDSTEPPVSATIGADGHSVDMVIHPHISELLKNADNAGERLMMVSLLRGFRKLLPNGAEMLSDTHIQSVLDRHAPLGIKKRLFVLTSKNASIQNDLGLPDYRGIQEVDEQEVLDDLGDRLIQGGNLQVGNIPREKQNAVANRAVALLYGEMERLVASLNPEQLLEWLIAHHERILLNGDYYEMNLPARIACFSSEEKVLQEFLDESSNHATTATAARFIIEYVSARPPSGIRPISLSIYDRLQALASHIINLGFVSDLIRYELSDVEIKILPSRRVAFSKTKYDDAVNFYQAAIGPDRISHFRELFAQRFGVNPESHQDDSLAVELDRALKAECAFSFTELIDFCVGVVGFGWEQNPSGIAVCEIGVFTGAMATRLGWPLPRVLSCSDLMSLNPRADYLSPDSPFAKEDVYPWRFNRPLSYLRRPFLRRRNGDREEIIWGGRHVMTSIEFFGHICSSGRLRATTLTMKQFLSKLNNQRGGRFNKVVGSHFLNSPRFIVKENIKKVPGLHGLREIGEIDVLLADKHGRQLFVLECKDLAIARTPHELALEVDNLFVGIGSKEAIVGKLQRKSTWIASHLDVVLKWMGIIQQGRKWKCKPMVVIDREMISPRLRRSSVQIVSFNQLKSMFILP